MSSTATSATSASVPASATAATTTTTATMRNGLMRGGDVYKGKYTNRSWQQLPPDIIRIIATHYLADFTANTYIPHTWLAKEMWHSKTVYTVLRDANDLERLMRVSPAWKAALETHIFWYQACPVIDPHDTLAQHIHANPPIPSHHSSHAPRQTPSPYRHFRTLTSTSCIVCLINAPPAAYLSTGLFLAKRTHLTPTLGVVTLCKDHRRAFFCGLCLREAPVSECEPETGYRGAGGLGLAGFGMGGFPPAWGTFAGTMGTNTMAGISPYAPLPPSLTVCCAENEDDETWPGVETTCRSCRIEFLWRRISGSDRDREAVGGALYAPTKSHLHNNNSSTSTVSQLPSSHSQLISNANSSSLSTPSSWPPSFHSTDYQTRHTVDAFIELGEGSISEVLCVAREKLWLRKETKMVELMGQALAAARWEGGGGMGDNMNMEEIGGLVGERATEETLLATEWEGEVGNGNSNSKGKNAVSEDGQPLSRSTSLHSDVPHQDDAPSNALLDDVHSYTSQGDFDAEQDARSDVAEVDVRSTHSYDYGFDTSRLSQDRDHSSPSSSELPCLLKDSSLSTQDDTDPSLHVDLSRGFPNLSPSDDDDARSTFSDRSDTSDPDLLTLTEDLGGIRELAILDWARGRILDGWWCSPADEWYGYVGGKGGIDNEIEGGDGGWRTVRAVHPCPWSVSTNSGSSTRQQPYRQTSMLSSRSTNHSPPSYSSSGLPSSQHHSHNYLTRPKPTHPHPLSRTIDAPTPPSFALCEQAYRAYQKQLRLILLPAMKNIVKRMVAEAGASENGRADPAIRAARMSMEEVLAELRTPGVWFDRVDWVVMKDEQMTAVKNGGTDDSSIKEDDVYSERGQRMEGKKNDEDESSSTGTGRSDGSHATSPVLSTTTLRTTPSPSPVREKEETFSSEMLKSTTPSTTNPNAKSTAGLNTTKLTIVPIPISPILESPSLLHPIPYVPLTAHGMPQYSMEAFKAVWREACAPLYSCRCAICERALIKTHLAATVSGGARPSEHVQVPVQSQNQLVYATHPQQRPIEVVRLEEHPPRRFFEEEEEEEEEEVYAEEEEESEEGDDLEFSSDEAEGDGKTRAGRRDLRIVGDPGTIGKIYLSLPPQTRSQTQLSVTPRKRSSGDLDGDHVDRDLVNGILETSKPQKGGTPPKRPRREASDTNPVLAVTAPTPDNRGGAASQANSAQYRTPPAQVKSSTPTRQRKRSSEEIDTSGDNVSVGNGDNRESIDTAKRARVDIKEGGEILKAGLVKGGELDGLYVFEAESGGVDMS